MIRFFTGLAIGIYFFTKMDILIWQRIFEANALYQLGVGTYHQGWTYALFGFMALGFVFFFPHIRRMIMFPLSLVLLAFCGLEDVLYYWLDGRAIPAMLPWLNNNPLILKPLTRENLILSAAFWILTVVLVEAAGTRLDRMMSTIKLPADFSPETILAKLSTGFTNETARLRMPLTLIAVWYYRIAQALLGRGRDTVAPK